MVHSFSIDFPLLKIKGFLVTFPFKMVTQTPSKEIETYCMKTWPILLDRMHSYSPEDNLNKIKMRNYIKQNFVKQSVNQKLVHNYFYDNYWFGQLNSLKDFSSLNFIEFDAKIWTDPEIPYLEIKGEITVDLTKILEYYLQKNYIQIIRSNKFVKEELTLRFMVELPKILTYIASEQIRELVVKFFEMNFKKQRSLFNTKLVTLTKLKNIHTYKNKIHWVNQKEIKVEINDLVKILVKKTMRPIPLTAAGFIAYKYMKNQKELRKALNKISDIYY